MADKSPRKQNKGKKLSTKEKQARKRERRDAKAARTSPRLVPPTSSGRT